MKLMPFEENWHLWDGIRTIYSLDIYGRCIAHYVLCLFFFYEHLVYSHSVINIDDKLKMRFNSRPYFALKASSQFPYDLHDKVWKPTPPLYRNVQIYTGLFICNSLLHLVCKQLAALSQALRTSACWGSEQTFLLRFASGIMQRANMH
jgi:hypothetical protein